MYKERINEILLRENITKRSLAKKLNIDESCFSHFIKEEDLIPIKHLNELANILDVSLDYIFNFTEAKKYLNSSKNIDKEKMKNRLKELRKSYSLTQIKLASILNIGNGTIAEYELGHFIISTHALYTICKKYHVPADYLLGKIDYLPPNTSI